MVTFTFSLPWKSSQQPNIAWARTFENVKIIPVCETFIIDVVHRRLLSVFLRIHTFTCKMFYLSEICLNYCQQFFWGKNNQGIYLELSFRKIKKKHCLSSNTERIYLKVSLLIVYGISIVASLWQNIFCKAGR